jgi:glycosyltransferase involved in cell wall biosynthesis
VKFISIQHRLGGYSSHHFNEAYGFKRQFARRGKEFVVLANINAQPHVVRELDARPVFDDPTFRLEWSFEERSRRFVAMLHEHVDRLVKADDCVMVTIATQLEAHALIRWFHDLPERKKPWVVVLFISDRWNRGGRDEYDRQIAEFAKLRESISHLSPKHESRFIFCALTDLLADELSGLLGVTVRPAPMPLDYGQQQTVSRSAIPRVAILGGTRREKGSYLIPDIIRATRSRVDVEFLVHLTNNTLTAGEAAQLATIANEPGVIVIHEALTLDDYEAALSSADVLLFPYESIPYRKRTSGVFGEAVAFGKPVVVTPGTWMADQIAGGRASGTIAVDIRPTSIVEALAACLANLESHRASAESLSNDWRKTISLSAFVEFMESEIATRTPPEQKSRRRFWRRWRVLISLAKQGGTHGTEIKRREEDGEEGVQERKRDR